MKFMLNRYYKILFVLVILASGFLFSKSASAATYYVDNTGGLDANNGLTTGTAWKTVTKVNGFAFSAGDIILFKGGETWATQLAPTVSGTAENHITFGTYNKSGGLAKLTLGISANGKNYLTFDGLYITGGRIWATGGESSLYFYNCIIENTGTYGFDGQIAQTDIRFYNCVFSRNTRYDIDIGGVSDVTVRNSIFLSNAAADEGVWNVGAGGNLNIDYSLINTGQSVSTSNITDGGHNLWYPDPKLTAYPTSITPRFTFTFDDSGTLDSFNSLVTGTFDTYGVKGTIFVSPALWTAGQQTIAATLSAAGHEIANHTLNHEDLTATQAFVVTSTNTNPTVNVNVAATTITLSCDEAGNVVVFNWSGNKTIQDLKNAVVGKGWTITNSAQNSKTRQNTLLLDELADSAGAQVAPYTTLLDISAPNYKFWAHEVNDAQDQIQAVTGIRPTTMAYPYGFNNAALIAWLKTDMATSGLVTARQVAGAPTTLTSISKWNFPQRSYGWSSTDTEDTVRAWARRMYFYAISTPGFFLTYDHATTQAFWTRYGWMIDELQSLGATFNTYGELVSWIASDHADNGTNWTKTYTATGADYHLLSNSPAIDAGTNVSLTQDISGMPVPQFSAPDIGAYEYANTADLITQFDFSTPSTIGTINNTNHTITLSVPNGTNVTSLSPTIAVSTGATISPLSGAPQDFTNPVVYTVTAQDTATTQNYTVTVTILPPTTYTITAIAGANGSISPSGGTSVVSGGSQSYTITPSANYHVSDVLVDDVSVGAVSSYDFTGVVAGHTISATFAIDTKTLTYTAGTHGTIFGTSPQTVNYGLNGTAVTAVPDSGYHFTSWDDGGLTAERTDSNITANHTYTASFEITAPTTYTITPSAGSHGSISPSGATTVNSGDNQAFSISADSGYHISDVVVDGSSVGAVSSYTFSNVVAAHTISATFAVTSSGGGGCYNCYVNPSVPSSGFKMSINGGVSTTSNRNVFLGFNAGVDIKKMAISMTGDFTDASQENYVASKQWDLCSKFGGAVKNPACPDGKYTIYAKFYTAWGRTSDSALVSSTIVLQFGSTTTENLQLYTNLPFTNPFTKYLQYRQTNADIKRLQIFLNSDPDTKIADTGAGSPEKETNYFGLLTYKAVIKFQEKYAKDILAPWGFVKGTGYVGKTTLAKINELMKNK